jgi:hypothetical protein
VRLAACIEKTGSQALTKAGAEHIRFIDDITLMARSPEELAAHLKRAMRLIQWLGLHLAPGKTQVAYLGPGKPSQATLVVPGGLAPLPVPQQLPVHQEIDVLGVHFYGDGRFRARERTVRRLLSKVLRIIEGKDDPRSPLPRYITATATINRMLGYQVGTHRPGTKAGAKTKPGPPTPRTHRPLDETHVRRGHRRRQSPRGAAGHTPPPPRAVGSQDVRNGRPRAAAGVPRRRSVSRVLPA